MSAKNYHLMTWGCQMNDEDSEQIALYLEGMGYQHTEDALQADVVLLNTCSVRQKPEDKVYSKLGILREAKLEKPDMLIGVCGCMAQVESAEIKRRAPYVDLVVGTGNLGAIPGMIERVLDRRHQASQPHQPIQVPQTIMSLDLPARKGAIVSDVPMRNLLRKPKLKAHVPIMYGCDKFCTFCIVPYTRGRERSRSTAEILREVESLARGGTKEITLLGQTVNSYGKNMPEGRVSFATLLEQISDIRGIQRIRFTSPYPKDFTDDLIDAIARLPKVCKYVHLPLQVADDDLLLEMKRGYTLQRYTEIVQGLRSACPEIAISTDIMLGYPGETDEQYWNTMRYVEETRFDFAFMFAYSPRRGTKAAEMDNQVPHPVKIDRLSKLIELQNRITIEINESMVGTTHQILVEGISQRDPNKLSGNTDGLKTAIFTAPESETRPLKSFTGKMVDVKLTSAGLTGFFGEMAVG
jgi:tRNA-2-methylthio-N6-dimethylallyladenosine synthase